MAAWFQSLRRASFRGVPFGMRQGQATYGRRKARHDYPYRDTIWLEDQGKLPREFRVLGFLVSDSAVYGGGEVLDQLAALERVAELSGQGVLIHPTRGPLTVDLINLVVTEKWDEGRYFEFELYCVQGGTQLFPSILGAFGDLVSQAAGLADSVGAGAFADAVLGPLASGAAAVNSLEASAEEWVGKVTTLASDATSLYGTLSQLGGADFGRYFNGRNSGFLAGLQSVYAGANSVADLLDLGSAQRAAISDACNDVKAAISTVGEPGGSANLAAKVQATVAAVQASAADPADGVRVLSDLAGFATITPSARQPAGVAMSDLIQRAAAASIARVSATYAPSSADDAVAVRKLVLAPVDAAVRRAGDTGADAVFQAMKRLRQAVVQDLASRGGSLTPLTDIVSPVATPASVLAQRQYGDVGRAAELIVQADPIHPWFMPLDFRALAA